MNHSKTSRFNNPFFVPFIIILVFAIIELLGGVWTRSLALLGDAWHMCSDALALGLAMLATYRVNKAKANHNKSKAELVVSIINVGLLLVVIVWIVIEALERMATPREVLGGYVMMIAFVGLVVNLVVIQQLHHHQGEKGLNYQAALLHVIGDLLGSVAALTAGAVIYLTGWQLIDPILSIFISLLLLFSVLSLSRKIWLTMVGTAETVTHHHHH